MRHHALPLMLLGVLPACSGDRPAEVSTRELLTTRTLGLAYLDEHRLEEAEAEFQKLTRLVPDDPLGFVNLALVNLRMGRYQDAERWVEEALELTPRDPDILLMLATALRYQGDTAAARGALDAALQADSTHTRVLFALAELAEEHGDRASQVRRLATLVARAPENVAGRLQYIDGLLASDRADDAAAQLEELEELLASMPEPARPFFDQTLRAARREDAVQARGPFATFHDFLRVTSAYQRGLRDLRGPGGQLAGVPRATFSASLRQGGITVDEVAAAIAFTDVTALAGLDSGTYATLAVADYDGDGDPDVLVAGHTTRLYRNDLGALTDVTDDAGLGDVGAVTVAAFGDVDNDGILDLYLATDGAGTLWGGTASGRFERRASLPPAGRPRAVLFVDADQDGDLDLFVAGSNGARLYRNNLDGSFTEQAAVMGLALGGASAFDATFADLDYDDDVDLVVAGATGVRVLRNDRQSRFTDRTDASGLPTAPARALSVGDVDHDGFVDLVVAPAGGGVQLFRNLRDGRFERAAGTGLPASGSVEALALLDYDNDGHLDLVVLGASWVRLYRGTGDGRFSDRSQSLPAGLGGATVVATMDYGEDGDLDLVLLDAGGRVRLLRNDGADANSYLKLELTALAQGNGKNNRFGIGGRVEVRADDLYQVRTVTSTMTHFGLGHRLKADVVQIRWPNGVLQDLYYPGSDEALLEQQTLKGSCAFLYTWDGEGYRFVTDVMWRSALGMPLGIMGSDGRSGMLYAPPFASQEYLRIPPDALRPRNGRYTIQLTEELWEVAYLDEVRLVAVDHPDSVDVFVDEKFVPPTPARLEIHQVAGRRPIRAAHDERGRDVTALLREADHRYVGWFRPARYQGITQLHDLVIDLGDVPADDVVRLYLTGWVFPSDASINVAVSQSDSVTVIPPSLQVPNGRGGWRTAIADLSFPAGKQKTMIVDLTGKLAAGDPRVRIRTNMEVYWDRAFVAVGAPAAPVTVTQLHPVAADLHERGYSREYRLEGRYGPHWFDYDDVTATPRWRPIEGRYTRLGDVRELLAASDDRYVVMAPGDETTVEFQAGDLPALPAGWTRTFLLYTDGWIKDADLNTATGNTVHPLPLHGMREYPYRDSVAHPDPGFTREYLTRVVTRFDW